MTDRHPWYCTCRRCYDAYCYAQDDEPLSYLDWMRHWLGDDEGES